MNTEKMISGEKFFRPVDFDPFADGEVMLTVPSTEAQKEIWLSTQFGLGANCAFNESMSFRIVGPLDTVIFRECLLEVIQRHEALRTTLSSDGTTLSIANEIRLTIPIIDISMASDKGKVKLDALIAEEVTKPFDLTHGPLVRVKIVILGEERYHVLFTAHHIICDGWSIAIIIQDLKGLYAARIACCEPNLPEPFLFSQYAIDENEHVSHDFIDEPERFWIDLYAGEAPLMDIPTDRPRPVMRTFNADRVDYSIDTEIVEGIKKTGAKYGCTFITILVAAFKSYLFRLTSQNDIILGIPAAGQLATGKNNLVGHCVNLLPLISQLKGTDRFCDYLKDIRNLMFDANQYQQYTFGTLIKKLKIHRDPSRIPLVPIIFNIDQMTKEDELAIEGIDFDVFTNHRKFENFELYLNLTSSAKGHDVVIECTYNENLFNKETIRSRLAEFEALLASVARSPEQRLSEISLLPEGERHRLLVEFNNTAMDYSQDKCFHQLFEEQVQLNPDKVAVAFEGDSISYATLNSKSNQLAHYLIDAGVGPGVLVGLFVDRSIEMMIGLLGILKAGGAYVPLDPDYPKERLSYMLGESGSPVLITQEKFKADLPESDAQVIFVDSDWSRIGQESSENPAYKGEAKRPGPENLSYVIFTSGSTGKPKGVQIPHRAVTNFLTTMSREPGMTSDDTLLAVTTLSFDIHVLELYMPLIVGAKVVVASREVSADGMQLSELLEESGTTIMQATPSTWRLMIAAGWGGSEKLKILCGGEAFPKDLVGELIERSGSVWNMYGPTETTVWSTCHQLTSADGPIFVGSPIGNTQTYVLDANMQLVPIGVSGELYIGGDGVTHGYLNRPDLTSKAFIPDPFSGKPNTFIYKTGDLVKYHSNGAIEYLNRLDNQVKVRGFRIELGEIETILGTHPAIKQAIAGIKEFGPGDQRLIGYYECKGEHSVEVGDLRSHLRKTLPDYLLPQHFMEMESFPLTPAGKIDRKSMPMPDEFQRGAVETYVPPGTSVEKEIAQIWSEVLKIERLGVRDNFFDIGGHSLLGMQVVNRLRKLYQIKFSIAVIFEAPTIELIGRLIENRLAETNMAENVDNKLISNDREVFEI